MNLKIVSKLKEVAPKIPNLGKTAANGMTRHELPPSVQTAQPQTQSQPLAQPKRGAIAKAGLKGDSAVQDIIAPSAIEVDFDHLKINNHYVRTLFVAGYPRYVNANWLSPLINFDHSLEISMFIYPVESKSVLDDLRRKIAEMEAEIATDMERGRVVDPGTQAKLEDALSMQEQLAKGAERFFQFGLYITIPAETIQELNEISREVESTLASLLIIPKHATLQMEEGLKTTLPVCLDYLNITRNMDTTSLATTFPFTSSELTANEGILYGINEHNGSLIVFDRFSMENYNSTVFAKAGGGKSYLVKLEVLRSLMFDAEVIIIDPESEYERLAEAVGGEYISFGFNSKSKINPFDLSQVREEGVNELNNKLLSLHSLFKIIMGEMDATEEAILDRALMQAYQMKGINQDPETQGKEPPLLEDLYKSLIGMEDQKARLLADRLEKYVKGSFAGIFDHHSNVDIKNPFTVFSLRDLEASLRPTAMFIILDFIWTRVRRELKKRILVVDEAWFMMRSPDSANFLNSIAKRARKYYLGVTTITQDVEDFLKDDIGKAIVTNSSIQVLMKQHPAAIEKVANVFYLSEGEKQFLLACDVGEGLFFAGTNHVAMKVVSSPQEHELITSKPQEILAQKQKDDRAKASLTQKPPVAPAVGSAPKPAPELALSSTPQLTSQPAPQSTSQPNPLSHPTSVEENFIQKEADKQDQAKPQEKIDSILEKEVRIPNQASGQTPQNPPPWQQMPNQEPPQPSQSLPAVNPPVNPLPPRFKNEIIVDNGPRSS
jgi:conjugal transfer ATP-binding protein TraC